MFVKRIIAAVAVALSLTFVVSGCDSGTSGQDAESATGQKNYDNLVKQEPAHDMTYPQTRKTINFWIDTWGQGKKVAYTYLMNSNGDVIGYYVTEGPPVSMCTSLRPSYQWADIPGDGDSTKEQVPAPASDGVYYSGGECTTYYAKDANTGAYIQFTAGMGINPLLYDQPLSPGIVKDAPNLGQVSK